jgi:hypothetical protein
MRSFPRYLTLFAFGTFLALSVLGGCASIGEAIDCDQMCDELKTCVDGDISVSKCTDRCQDRTDTNELRNELDECTDCLDHGYACAEVADECPVCTAVTDRLL